MLPSFLPPLTHGPIAPEIFSSRLHFTSSVALNAILNSFLLSFEKTRYMCLWGCDIPIDLFNVHKDTAIL